MFLSQRNLILSHPFFKNKTGEEIEAWAECLEEHFIPVRGLLENPEILKGEVISLPHDFQTQIVSQDLKDKIIVAQNNPGKIVPVFLEEGSEFLHDVIYLQYRPLRVYDWGYKIKYSSTVNIKSMFSLEEEQLKYIDNIYQKIAAYDYCEVSQERFAANITNYLGDFKLATDIAFKLSKISPGTKVKIWKNQGDNIWQCFAETKRDLDIKKCNVELSEIEKPHYRSWANKKINPVLQQVTSEFRYQPRGKVFNPQKIVYQIVCEFDQQAKNKVRDYFLKSQGYTQGEVYKFESLEEWKEVKHNYHQTKQYIQPISTTWDFPFLFLSDPSVIKSFKCKEATIREIKSQLPHHISSPTGEKYFLSKEAYQEYKNIRLLLNKKLVHTTDYKLKHNKSRKIWRDMLLEEVSHSSTEFQFLGMFNPKLEVEEKICSGYEKQPGPRSEMGRIIFSVHPQKIFELLDSNQWGKLKTTISTNLPHIGRYHNLIQDKELTMPFGHKIFHGITGAKNPYVGMERLRTIFESGALKSISERRWHGISIHSLSPLGDIASGVDKGVPCKIGITPSFGDGIYVSISPYSLYREELWFSDQDFGPGQSRYQRYLDYAKSLGSSHYEDIHSIEVRQKHLNNCSQYNYNEVWFKHSVPIQDFEAIYYNDMFQEKEMLEKLCQEFNIPVYPLSKIREQTLETFSNKAVWKNNSIDILKEYIPENTLLQFQLKF